MTITQSTFAGGMSALFDSTKTPASQYRLALNGRVRRNAFEGRFEYVSYETPTGLHQAVFALDATLILMVAGLPYKILLDNKLAVPISTAEVLSNSAEYIYHLPVPAATNLKVNGQRRTTVSTYPETVILQDGTSQPLLLSPELTVRKAGTYDTWTYEAPEYVPIGLFMASSGNKSFIVSPDRKKIYQSVSGRQTDYVLDFDDNGNKRGDASTTALVVATAALTAIVPSQNSGLLSFTNYNAYAHDPDPSRPLFFGEIDLVPRDLFPVGAINHLAFSFASGESIFVTASGIQSFNQVMQEFRASNNSPFGGPIADYLVLPLTQTATATVDDYTFIAANTIYGPGVLVYDNRLQAYVSIDITPGAVKEFAVLQHNGLKRLFFITAEGLYELPIYSGTRTTAHIYFGEYNSQAANKTTRVVGLNLGFNDVRSSGTVVCELWTDKKLNHGLRTQQALTADDVDEADFSAVPQRYPLATETKSAVLSFDLCDADTGYASGVFVSIAADARLVSATIDTEEGVTAAALPVQDLIDTVEVYLAAGITPDVSTAGPADVELTRGSDYVFYTESTPADFLNGGSLVKTKSAPDAAVFNAKADLASIPAEGQILSYSTASGLIPAKSTAIILGGFGAKTHPQALEAVLFNRGINHKVVLGPAECGSTAQAKEFFAKTASIQRDVIETAFVNFYLISFIVDESTATVNSSGIMPSTPADMTTAGEAYTWLAGQLRDKGVGKFNIVCFALPPYSSHDYTPGFATLRWGFRKLGVHAVFSGGSQMERRYVDGVHYVNLASANTGVSPTAVLKLVATAGHVQCEFVNDNDIYDAFTIIT